MCAPDVFAAVAGRSLFRSETVLLISLNIFC